MHLIDGTRWLIPYDEAMRWLTMHGQFGFNRQLLVGHFELFDLTEMLTMMGVDKQLRETDIVPTLYVQ
jgi:hypothetical protein